MNIQLIMEAIYRIEKELAIVKQEMSHQIPQKKPRKLTDKQILRDEALRTLAQQREKDRLRAKKMFKKEFEALAAREKDLEKLLTKNRCS
ncbi:hypothetical protein [Pedobacter sp. V48]|uniref:hypothetical protein n=1 Tax=Pedobacter sp. V48 TaxID=509635 RepID=UPI0003E53BF9|nr:hypothetical protein [Pedobacter sp. V48]ETZ20190.1 hypothetical protein N824_08230 [Pedobacter sp. V48]